MSDSFFLDTNVFVYTFDSTSPAKARRAAELVRDAIASRKGVISYQVVQEFFNVAFRRFAHPMTFPEAEQYLGSVFRPLFAVQSSPALYLEGLRLSRRHRLSWYDALIVAAAVQSGCDVLYSEDLQHNSEIENLRIRNPFA